MKKLSARTAESAPANSGRMAELDEMVLDWMASLGKNYQKDLSLGKAA